MARSQADKVYERIKADIISHVIRPGDQISNAMLAEQYQAGVTPVREALQNLTRDRLVQPIPRFGYVVSPITVDYLHEMFEIRSILEGSAARLAAIRATDQELNTIAGLAELPLTIAEQENPRFAFLQADASFHQAIADATKNQRLAEMISKQQDEMTRVMYNAITWHEDSTTQRISAHVELAQALVARDANLAVQISTDMIARSHQIALEAYAPQAHGPPQITHF